MRCKAFGAARAAAPAAAGRGGAAGDNGGQPDDPSDDSPCVPATAAPASQLAASQRPAHRAELADGTSNPHSWLANSTNKKIKDVPT